MPATTIPARLAAMIPGTIPAGTVLPGFGTVIRSSLTAYEVRHDGHRSWLPFVHVHTYEPVTPLVVFA